MNTWLLRPGELTLKGGNRKSFENVLKRNLLRMLKTKAEVIITKGRFYVNCKDEDCEVTEKALSHLMGIAGLARTVTCEKTPGAVLRACVDEAKKIYEQGVKTYKIEARRTDKSFPMDSYQLKVEGGNAIRDAISGLKVDIHNPECTICVEIREKAFIYSGLKKGLGGLPVGTAGRGLLLLSGGIDSPVAGFMMASRGMGIDAVHFHAYPYTSLEARQKVIDLANILGSYCMGIRLFIIGFTAVQKRIKERAPENWLTVLLRMAMLEASEKAAYKIKSKCLISGESLSQVASQTIENLTCIQSRTKLPILRPLIGMDKISIIGKARQLNTYETSILPYEDCCILFSPPHPVLCGNPAEAARLYEELDISPLIDEALKTREIVKCGFY